MNLAIIGAGPSGLAAARAALQRQANVFVLDKFAHTGGLLRYGVGFWNNPVKELQNKLLTDIERLAQRDENGGHSIKFRPNSNIGESELKMIGSKVDAIVLACGGKHTPIPLKFAGQDATVSCQNFVGYYNNAPWVAEEERARIRHRLECEGDVIIAGFGNVALDVITFLKLYWSTQLKSNSPSRIHLVGRGSLEGAKWTKAVLREALAGMQVTYHGDHKSSFEALPVNRGGFRQTPVSLHIYDCACADYDASGRICIKYGGSQKEVLCVPKLLIPCLGFAEPAGFLPSNSGGVSSAAREHCPIVSVGWCATGCRGDAGSAIVSGNLGVRHLFSTMKSTFKRTELPIGREDEWIPWSLAKG